MSRTRYIWLFLVIIIFCNDGCQKDSTNPTTVYVTEADPLIDSSAQITVGRVIDGDTFVIGINKDSFSVRILGIDAFEVRHDARLDSQAVAANISIDSAYSLGQMGKYFADSLLSKQKVLLVRDYSQDNFDIYTRLLRKVYFYDKNVPRDFGALMIQKKWRL